MDGSVVVVCGGGGDGGAGADVAAAGGNRVADGDVVDRCGRWGAGQAVDSVSFRDSVFYVHEFPGG